MRASQETLTKRAGMYHLFSQETFTKILLALIRHRIEYWRPKNEENSIKIICAY